MTQDRSFHELEDRPLLDTASRLALDERRATAALLRALIEIDRRQLYLAEGYASMFAYCTRALHLSEGGAYNRIEAARAARRYPAILDLIEHAHVTLTTVRLLAPHLTTENHCQVLESARHKSKREVEEIAASLRPKPDAPTVMRRLSSQHVAPVLASTITLPAETSQPSTFRADVQARALAREMTENRAADQRIAPLAPGRYRLQVTLSGETHDKFRQAQTLLRYAVPSGDAAEILDRALTLLLGRLERQRFAATSRPRVSRGGDTQSRRIPAAVRRDVWRRDRGRCAFTGTRDRCNETAFLEFHHVQPYAVGGPSTVTNIELRCRAHNGYEARVFFGVRDVESSA